MVIDEVPVQRKEQKEVIITISGETMEAVVTLKDGTKTTDLFWSRIEYVLYNLTQDITNDLGAEVVKPAGLVMNGDYVTEEDLISESIKHRKCCNLLRIYGDFDPQKLQFIRVKGVPLYDSWVYF